MFHKNTKKKSQSEISAEYSSYVSPEEEKANQRLWMVSPLVTKRGAVLTIAEMMPVVKIQAPWLGDMMITSRAA